ncbi:MAG: glycosyltransferase family 1 protein [Gemmatimonadales bacterium]|nr:MAG: glycosyltransferase family 1 protein [Gemmatimonadales bacterium]
MRLLVLNWQDRLNPRSGGAEIHLHEIFGRLASAGWTIDLVCSGWADAPSFDEVDGIRIHRVGGRHSHWLRARGEARRILGERPVDLLVEDLNKVPLFTPLWSPVPVGLVVHHLFGRTAFQEAALPLAAATWLLERPIPRVYRGVPTIAVSESTREDLRDRGLEGPLEVIPNGIDLDWFHPDTETPRFSEPTLLYLGRLKRYKRIDLILEGVAELVRRGVPVRCLIAGKGDHRAPLEARADRLGLKDRVRFLGFVSEEEKRELLRRAWVHVCTSPKEGWGIANLEAAACATPTVASDSPGLRDSVRDGSTGILTPHGDVNALADALERLLSDSGERARQSTEARRFAQGFSWDAMAEAVGRSLEGMVVRTGRPA